MGFFSGFRLDTLLKRVCKSILKKQLGDLILGDLDLDQFDIQLARGTLQLNDIALDADFINSKLSGFPIMLKEGSIKSLLVRFAASCEITVEELELVFAPSVASEVADVHAECSVSGSTTDTRTSVKIQSNESDSNQFSTSVSQDVDEGVKKIANAVKWFLTSFNIKLKNVYVVFDPQTSSDSRLLETNHSLVLRIKELEFGTKLGLFKLDNFLTFHEAVLEFLKMDDVETLLQNDPIRGTADFSAHHSTTALLTGPAGGFSGELNLSIPWNKGCLNFEKIDADVSVDPLELRLQISSVRWIMNVWDSLQRKPVHEQNYAHNIPDISISSSRSALSPPASSYLKPGSDSVMGTSEYNSQSTFSQSRQDKVQSSFLRRANVITDWMEPAAHEDQGDPDSDCDESVDQFFECCEELRNSQSSLGTSGIWDWTSSVFNAISFASTLASGYNRVHKASKVWSLPKLHDQKITKNQNSNTTQDHEETGSSMCQELLNTTELLFHIQASCVSVQLNKKDCELLNKLLGHVLDGIPKEEISIHENCKDQSALINDTCIQTSIIFECGILEVCNELDEVVEVSPSLQAELEGPWNSIKLKLSKFSLFSYSNVGGLSNASFVGVNHGEGELWGSVSVVPGESKYFLLVACKDSAFRRGDGQGTNVLSMGTAGCSFIHIRNPNLQENYTSVAVRSYTIVAPGGRMDWINTICLLFSSGPDGTEKSDDSNVLSSSQPSEPYLSSFFLEFADVAVSYEPHFKSSALSTEAADHKFFSCLLAASSFKLHNKSAPASAATDFDIQLRELGLLISESSSSRNVTCSYGIDYLYREGYAKVAQNTLIQASLEVYPNFWKIEISDSQFDIGTCNNTFYGLIGLISQLQQLYGPDTRDALDYLQSRWNSVQHANKHNIADDASDEFDICSEGLVDSGHFQSDGLLGDIIENAFYMEDCMDKDFCESNCHHSCSSSEMDDWFELNIEREDAGWYNNVPLMIVENHVLKKKNKQVEQVLRQESVCSVNPDESCNLKGKVHIHGIDVKWRMYAGDDWLLPRKDSTRFTCTDGRDRSSYLEFTLTGLSIQVDMYPDGNVSTSKLFLAAQDLTLCDQSIRAPWKLVLGCYKSKDFPRESCSSAFRLELESVSPKPQAPLEDYRLLLEILPLQLHLDQGQLNFLLNFFRNDSCKNDPHLHCENAIVDLKGTGYASNTIVDEALLPFFQKFDVKPLVLHINYIPRQFDPVALGKGNYAELLNILPWKGIDLKLKHVSAMGIYGWNSIGNIVAAEWLEDISKNQVHKLLKGLAPIRSLASVASGTKKLVSLPIQSYKKDRKLLKGMQRGAVAFIRSVTIEAVGLGVHLAAGAHDMLVKAERALTAAPPPLASCAAKRTKHNIRANQPENAQQGMKQAYESLTDGVGRTASILIGNPIKLYNRGAGARSALATAICGAPAAAVAPVSASAHALHSTFLGLRNSLDLEHKKQSMYKYHGPHQA